MYFNKTNNFFHGITFHHFHDDLMHTRGQGSISKDDFYKLINYIGKNNILDAEIFFEKFKNNTLKEKEVCLTFDDAIKCQIDIALPVLEDLKIKSFFFIYTSM
ncbi:polysaccharide deacetylase family protein, partial [Candidatus Pelagibacter sp.]|nr:polysaccharide deacetylase family protein [Candidatus Pelagibacter sp.]